MDGSDVAEDLLLASADSNRSSKHEIVANFRHKPDGSMGIKFGNSWPEVAQIDADKPAANVDGLTPGCKLLRIELRTGTATTQTIDVVEGESILVDFKYAIGVLSDKASYPLALVFVCQGP